VVAWDEHGRASDHRGSGTCTTTGSTASRSQKEVNTAHARRRGPGERVDAEPKNWRVLHEIRSCPTRAADLVAAVRTFMIVSA
jgi:hypothetical protein